MEARFENNLLRDNRAFEGYEWGNVTIDTVCDLLTDSRAEGAVDGLARVNDLTLMMEGERCLDHTYQAEVRTLELSTNLREVSQCLEELLRPMERS